MDKAQPILDHYPANTIQLSWIMGHDTMTRLFDPKYYKDVHADMAPFFEQCDVICSSRPGYGTREEMMEFVQSSGHGDKVTLVDLTEENEEMVIREADIKDEEEYQLINMEESEGANTDSSQDGSIDHPMEIREMSSTVVRTAVKDQNWALVDRCVTPSVKKLIQEHGLYAS